eukprot:scaffold26000_cov171-Skeletonema_marinoi.AAC.1
MGGDGRSASAGTAVLFDDEVKVYRRPTLTSECMRGRRVRWKGIGEGAFAASPVTGMRVTRGIHAKRPHDAIYVMIDRVP